MITMDKNHDISEQALRKAEALAEDILEMESVDTAAAYQRAASAMRRNRRTVILTRLTRYAAILTLPLLMATLVLSYLLICGDTDPRMVSVTAAAGSVMRYELPDHSIVWLNAGSTLTHPTAFSRGRRDVTLDGEGYFEVEANKKKPFYVNTPGGLTIYVYGTRFDVSAYNDDEDVETVLERGAVNVITPDKNTLRLSPGERIHYDKRTGVCRRMTADVYEMTAWKDGKLVFRDTPLDIIFKRLERHFNVDIVFRNHSGRTPNYRATFRDESLPQILDCFARTTSMKWAISEPQQQSDGTFPHKQVTIDLY